MAQNDHDDLWDGGQVLGTVGSAPDGSQPAVGHAKKSRPNFALGVDDFSRLVYLVATHKIRIPKGLLRYLPFSDELSRLHLGVGAAGDVAQLTQLFNAGSSLGEGSVDEAKTILSRILDTRDYASSSQKLEAYRLVMDISSQAFGDSTPFAEVDVSPDAIYEPIQKWASGFQPLDIALDGLYQSLVIFMAQPGTGKTSITLSVAEELVKQGTQCWAFETELPAQVLQGRMAPMLRRTSFASTGSRIFCGPYSIDDVIEMVKEDPNPNRIIIFDGPDAMFVKSSTGERRFDLEQIYMKLVILKHMCKAVFATSQPRRNDQELKITSVAESWSKSWLADVLVGIQRHGPSTLMLSVLKNRFGPGGGRIFFNYNYETMEWDLTAAGHLNAADEDWDDL